MKFLVAILILIASVAVSAQTRIVSIDAFDFSYTGGLLIKSDNGKNDDRDEKNFRLNLNYAQNWGDYVGLMWKVRAYINRQDVEFGDSDSLETRWGGAGGILYNFNPEAVKDSIFVGAMAGVERATYEIGGADDEAGFNMFADFEGGKRWDMGSYATANISYAPTLAVTFKRYGGDIRDTYYKSGHEIKINFLKFDILF